MLSLTINPHGHLLVENTPQAEAGTGKLSLAGATRIRAEFDKGQAAGMLHLAVEELTTVLPPSLGFVRDFARDYLTKLSRTPELEQSAEILSISAPPREELAFVAMSAPPMKGLEYLSADVLAEWWSGLDVHARAVMRDHSGGPAAYLREKNAAWRLVGRVTFHLAENSRDAERPFAFLATYTETLSANGQPQHLPLARALTEYAGAKDRAALLNLLTPVSRAADTLPWVKELVDSRALYQPLAWRPTNAYQFLKDLPRLEAAGVIVRIPNWWKPQAPPRAQVSVTIGKKPKSTLSVDAMLDFSVAAVIDGQALTEAELREALASAGGLVRLRGQWVEVDKEKLSAALDHWKRVEREVGDGMNYFEAMRLLAGTGLSADNAAAVPEQVREWTGVSAGEWLEKTLAELRDPSAANDAGPPGFGARLRPYQEAGVNWLRFMTRLGLGACLADDMGLGKTIQVLALLMHVRRGRHNGSTYPPDLLIVPASLIANWMSEIARFAPQLSAVVAHPSEKDVNTISDAIAGKDLVITTYGMLTRLPALREKKWNLVILDEAQAIKNSGTRQTRAAKELHAAARIALSGTPIENRLSDLWSLFDFLNPGLLGGAKEFGRMVKEMQSSEQNHFAPLRVLVKPYILRRLKTDKRVISDLPDKVEVKAWCGLSKEQAALYEQAVRELEKTVQQAEGIQRRGIVLASLMRLKQICNHPSQWTGDGVYELAKSGKFERLREICEELAQRQEKALIFTQFREITGPLAEQLRETFGREGLVLHGSTSIPQRKQMVDQFAREDGPPFFVLSLKAGGTGLNLTAASHVIHFDRWWNPAVENQATDRAFRIGQKKNVMVHKFVCRGTVEEKIDALIEEKLGLSRDLLEGGTEKMLTELDDRELLRFVSLDIKKAMET